MKITIESTSKLVTLDGVPARVWQGKTETGIPVACFITRIAVDRAENCAEFERELTEHAAPRTDLQTFPLRMVL